MPKKFKGGGIIVGLLKGIIVGILLVTILLQSH